MCSGGRAQRRAEREYREKVGGVKRVAQAEQEMISRQQTGRRQRRLLSPFEASLEQAKKDLTVRKNVSLHEGTYYNKKAVLSGLGITEEQWQSMSKEERDEKVSLYLKANSYTQQFKESSQATYGPGGTL